MPQQDVYKKGSIWPTIGVIALLITIACLSAFGYMSYAHNVELSQQNSDLSKQILGLIADKDSLTARVDDLSKELARLQCDGVWNGESCAPHPISISAKVASGTSPFIASFTVRAKSAKYAIDYGDGTSGYLSGPNPPSGADCAPKEDGLCEFNLKHSYTVTSPNDMSFEVKVMRDANTVAATVPITVVAKK